MKIHSKYKPELVCSRDETYFSLNNPYLNAAKKMVFATDGHSLVGVPVETEKDEQILPKDEAGCYVSAHALQVTHKEKRIFGLLDLDLIGDRLSPLGLSVKMGTPMEGKFPGIETVLPRLTERKMEDPISEDGTVTVSFNARFLLRIAEALGSGDQVVITFKVGKLREKAIKVRSGNPEADPREVAALMACSWQAR